MRGSGRGKSGRGGTGRGRGPGSFPERSSSPSQGPLQTERISSGPIQRISPETQSSRNLDENVRLSVEAETGAVRRVRKEDLRHVAKATGATVIKHGGKIKIIIPDDIDRAVGSGAGDIVNYSGWLMRTTISFRDGNWQKIVLKHGEAMWLRVRDKFEVLNGLPEYKLQGFDVELDDWKHLVEYFGSDEFKEQLHQLIIEQQSEEIENPMTSDMILSSVLGVRSGYVRGKGHGKKPLKKSQMQQRNIESGVSSAVESMCQEM
ncbi:hypothetical protein BC332_24354 [Capsicum chinense]|nr:hypothetical protein BC332_24354 [Capsicum chinense]